MWRGSFFIYLSTQQDEPVITLRTLVPSLLPIYSVELTDRCVWEGAPCLVELELRMCASPITFRCLRVGLCLGFPSSSWTIVIFADTNINVNCLIGTYAHSNP